MRNQSLQVSGMLSANSQWGLNHIQSQTGNTKVQMVPSGHQFIPPKVFSGEHPSPHPPKLKLGKLSRTPLDHLESLLRDTQQAACLLAPRLRMLGAAWRSRGASLLLGRLWGAMKGRAAHIQHAQ